MVRCTTVLKMQNDRFRELIKIGNQPTTAAELLLLTSVRSSSFSKTHTEITTTAPEAEHPVPV
jgi:hypothetical protein